MNAPTTPATLAAHQNIALDLLSPSATNPRKRFDDKKLAELAESMKAQGVLQPLLVRVERHAVPGQPIETGRFEIIAGERRYRAAKMAGLLEVPCFVRNLTDQQVLHAQVIENLQRDDLHPLEEADGYQRMMTEFGSTAESLGAEIGKSKAYVYGRIKLCDLVEEARQAFFDGLLDASTALLIARIPVAKLQIEATHAVTETGWDGEKMSYRYARDMIQREFMLDLNQAPFDRKDADLLPKAGACSACPKRTGNQPGLFDDVKNKDVCTDTVCFGMKKVAYVLRLQNEAAQKGDIVIKGKEAKKLLPERHSSAYYQLPKSGLATLDSHIPNDPKGRTWEQALKSKKLLDPVKDGQAKVTKTLIEDPHNEGELIQAISIEGAAKALREAGYEISLRGTAQKKNSGESARLKAVIAIENTYRSRLFDTLHQQIEANLTGPAPKVHPEIYLLLADELFSRLYDPKLKARIARNYVGEALANNDAFVKAMEEMLPTMTMAQHFMIMVDCLLVQDCFARQYEMQRKAEPETLIRVAGIEGIDAAAIKQEVEAEAKRAADEAKAKTKAKKPGKKAKVE
jgi:ParB/RepB/Spo0J family partition protein